MRFTALGVLACAAGIAASAQTTAPWDYEGKRGPLAWGKLDPAYHACSQGKEQSPVDIRGARLNTALKPVEYHYRSGPVTMENTGRTIRVYPQPGSYIVVDGVRYDLEQFHFHHPSEESVKGRLTDMDVHLVHKSQDGKQVVIAVRFNVDPGSPNAVIAALWRHLPTKTGTTDKVAEEVNPGGLLPADRGYWTYVGSLTAPPCTEGVRWFIYEDTLTVSREQLRLFASIFKMNTRPLQELHGRKIEANQ